MPRPARIEYEHAFYHVMNRGRGRSVVFHEPDYYRAFLDTLKEAHERFDAVIHAYCLMGNHYHLLIETPRANLGRIMRHINGVYTQRYNRLKKTDGSLFRGRYKAIVVDSDAYLLPLSRYIHRNPVEIHKPPVAHLNDYTWSSYPAYAGLTKAPAWLSQTMIYRLLNQRQKYKGYRNYTEAGVDEDIQRFYSKGNQASVLGDQDFRASIWKKHRKQDSEQLQKVLNERPGANKVIAAVAQVFNVKKVAVLTPQKGRQESNLPRKFAMYCCQQLADMPLKSIAAHFNLGHPGSVSWATYDVKVQLSEGKLNKELRAVQRQLNFIKYD